MNPDDGVRVYYEVVGTGSPLVLYAGFINAISNWYDLGYIDALREQYQLILIDPRGHGSSDKPSDPQLCEITKMTADVLVVLDACEVERAHMLGFSMGARAGYWVWKAAPDRLKSLLTIGGPIHPPAVLLSSLITLFEQGPEALADAYLKETPSMPPAVREQILASNTQAYIPLVQARQNESSAESFLPEMNIPVLVYIGEDDVLYDEVRLAADLLPNSTFVAMPGLNHNQSFYRADLVLPHITEFLERFKIRQR